MNVEELKRERKEIYNDALQLKKPKRIPTNGNTFTWKIYDSDLNVKLSEAIGGNWDLMEKIMREHMERYNFDAYQDYGLRNNNKPYEILGSEYHQIDDENWAINTVDADLMHEDEYHEYTYDNENLIWTKIAPRRFPDGITFGQVQNVVKAMIKQGEYTQKIADVCWNEYGVPTTFEGYDAAPPVMAFSVPRGIKGFSLDLRRHVKELDEFHEVWTPGMLANLENKLKNPKEHVLAPICAGWTSHALLNQKQFEKYFWNYTKKVIDLLEKYDSYMYLFCEADMLRFAEFFQEIPKGRMILHLEMDDIFEVRKKLPNICLAGGMPVTLLGTASKEKCLDYAKKLCDELGGTGYIFSQDKMMSFPYDATRENMLAVQDYVLNYKL